MRKEVRRLKENRGLIQMENDEVLKEDENNCARKFRLIKSNRSSYKHTT